MSGATETPEGVITDPEPSPLRWEDVPASSPAADGVQLARTPIAVYARLREYPYTVLAFSNEQWANLIRLEAGG